MSSKRVRFTEERSAPERVKRSRTETTEEEGNSGDRFDDEEDGGSAETAEGVKIKRTKKHTLDSDEEDETEGYQRLDMDKVEGQEESTLEYEGHVKIMPFNMKDDLEEGHFDADGTFIFDRKQSEIKDAWLDNIEWDNVKNAAGKHWGKLNDAEEDKRADDEKGMEPKEVYQRLLQLLNGKETIGEALKRLNSEKRSNAAEERKRRWAAKKSGAAVQEDEKSKQIAELTSLADSLISLGNMEAYQLDQTTINGLLDELQTTTNKTPGAKEATMDMFSEG